ncbi:hemolysin BL-binding protein [Pectobacterium versatile]|nr:Hypothetical protein SCC1_2388 [Pectobacterium versatile]POY56420.1 hemolysin BL-binding protein [Pectobacterium versatile]POY59990.1 hemolysin BL-binding protein [Pectobacterium versatile]POY64538.1 hemolysin BL-binding protein [Pectobacterium versatile]PRI19292.1 hypothetical protein BZY99_12125 [Pectobacterium versatile]
MTLLNGDSHRRIRPKPRGFQPVPRWLAVCCCGIRRNRCRISATLSRDVEHANNALSPIFNKEKEQKRLKQAQLIGEIGAQVMDIVRTEGELKAQKAAEAKGDAKVKRPQDGDSVAMWEDYKKALTESPTYKAEMQKYGTGSDFQRAAQAATAAIQALAGGDIQKAIASGTSPYLAQLVKDVTIPKDESKITASDIAANAMAHAVVGAVVAQLSGQDAAAGAIGASSGELIARAIMADQYPGKTANDLTEEEKQSVSALSTLASGLVSGLASNSTASAASGAQSGRNAVENNALSDIVENKVSGISQEEKYQSAQKQLVAMVEEFKTQNCAGLSAEACSTKISEHRNELLKGAAGFGVDFVPVVGDIKGFAEAQSAIDYLAAMVGLIPIAGDAAGKAIKAAEVALKKGDVAEASKLINKASDEISGYLPSPGNISLPSSGVGSNAAFSVTNAQLGKKLGKHVEDFGGSASNAADRQRVLDIINDIGSNPDKVVAGKFAGQGVGNGASRGDVFFRIKGHDVVVTKPDGSFVTVLKDGVNNTSVKNALKGDPK